MRFKEIMQADFRTECCTAFLCLTKNYRHPADSFRLLERKNNCDFPANSHRLCPQPFAAQWVKVSRDVDSLDWKGISADEIAKRVTGKVQCGSIILFHNAGEHTPEALPAILDYLLGEGYTLVPISEILLTGETYMDHTGKQCRGAASTT